jgi:hypothetical protein
VIMIYRAIAQMNVGDVTILVTDDGRVVQQTTDGAYMPIFSYFKEGVLTCESLEGESIQIFLTEILH